MSAPRLRDETIELRVVEAVEGLRRGWAVTPLRGKVPLLPGWQSAPRPSLAQAVAWARAGNVGLRTGAVSGLVVIDVDTGKGGDAAQLHLPRTVTVITGSGGLHLYFRHPGGRVRNSVGRLAPHVDVRGDGGQVVFVGSVHPITGRLYRWADGRSPEGIELARLPDEVLATLRSGDFANCANSAKALPRPPQGGYGHSRYGRIALDRQAHAVQIAPCGARNQSLNRAAFSLGRLVAAGYLSEQEVWLRLEWAAAAGGLPAREAARTILSGLAAGMREAGS